jgi:hypothetical protein
MFKEMDDSELVDSASATRAPGHSHANGPQDGRVAEWETIVDAVRAENTALNAMNARVVERVMANLRFVESPRLESEPVRPRAPLWRRVGGLSAACALVLVAAWVAIQSVDRAATAPAPAPALESAKVQIDREADQIQIEIFPDAWSLQQALDAVPEGSRVTMGAVEVRGGIVLEKPMTIVSQSGLIVIGRS